MRSSFHAYETYAVVWNNISSWYPIIILIVTPKFQLKGKMQVESIQDQGVVIRELSTQKETVVMTGCILEERMSHIPHCMSQMADMELNQKKIRKHMKCLVVVKQEIS